MVTRAKEGVWNRPSHPCFKVEKIRHKHCFSVLPWTFWTQLMWTCMLIWTWLICIFLIMKMGETPNHRFSQEILKWSPGMAMEMGETPPFPQKLSLSSPLMKTSERIIRKHRRSGGWHLGYVTDPSFFLESAESMNMGKMPVLPILEINSVRIWQMSTTWNGV